MEEKVIQWIILESRNALSEVEYNQLRNWREKDPQNEDFYQTNRLIWAQSAEVSPSVIPNTAQAWDRFHSTIQVPEIQPVRLRRSANWWQIAAVLILAVGVSIWVFQQSSQQSSEQLTVLTGNQESAQYKLADGSTVYLHQDAELTVVGDLSSGNQRSVQLVGEAFFNIHKDPARPFLINANDMEVRVLGTSFNVRTSEASLEVVVRDGKVAVSEMDGSDRVELVQNQRFILDRETGVVTVDLDPTENAWSWKSGILQFQATPLREVLRTIERHYRIQINLANPTIESCPFTSRFQEADISTVLQTIASSFEMEVRSSGQGIYYLTDGKCR